MSHLAAVYGVLAIVWVLGAWYVDCTYTVAMQRYHWLSFWVILFSWPFITAYVMFSRGSRSRVNR